MSEKKEGIKFDDLPESKQYKSLDAAGVYREFNLVEIEFQKKEPKKEKRKDSEEETVVEGKFIGPWVRFTFRNEKTIEQFVGIVFSPPTTPEDIKFHGGKFEGGVEIRKRTDKEEIEAQFNNLYYLYEQLGKALQVSPEKFISFKKGLSGDVEKLFKEMFDKFFAAFPLDKINKKPIDFKVLYNNNAKAKTSFLGLPSASSNNMVFGPYIEGRASILSVAAWEQKKLRKQFSNTDRAPQDNNTESTGISSDNSYKPLDKGPDGEPIGEEDLF